jgi:hypothetical protein
VKAEGGILMFGKKNLYLIKYYYFCRVHETIVSARNSAQAIKKFQKEWFVSPDILSIEEIECK